MLTRADLSKLETNKKMVMCTGLKVPKDTKKDLMSYHVCNESCFFNLKLLRADRYIYGTLSGVVFILAVELVAWVCYTQLNVFGG